MRWYIWLEKKFDGFPNFLHAVFKPETEKKTRASTIPCFSPAENETEQDEDKREEQENKKKEDG